MDVEYFYKSNWLLSTGESPNEEQGTSSKFSIPDDNKRSPKAKAVWKVELLKTSTPKTGKLNLAVTPAADAPIGQYVLTLKHREEEEMLKMVVLFNPWCPGRLIDYLSICLTSVKYLNTSKLKLSA